MQRARRQSEKRFQQACLRIVPPLPGSAIAPVPRLTVSHTNTAPAHISASWVTKPLWTLPWHTAFSVLTQRTASLLL